MTVFEQALRKAYEAISAALAEKGRIICAGLQALAGEEVEV